MRTILRTVAAASMIAASLVAVVVTPARAQGNCDWYARTALKQVQENEQKRCGFTGPAWSTDLRAHLTWCATASPDLWKSEAQKREQMLASCKK